MDIQEYSGYKRPRASKTAKNTNKNRRAIRILLAVFCVLICGVIAIGVYFIDRWKSDDYSSLQEENLVIIEPEPSATVSSVQNIVVNANEPAPTPTVESITYNGSTYVKNENVVNLLFLGIDTNSERKEQMMGYRSDMVLVCAVDTAEKKATLISIPRDTYTTMYHVNKSTGAVEKTVQNKVNAAYAFGGGSEAFSYPNSMACVEMFLERQCELEAPLDFELDIPVRLYAGIDMDGITQVASAVGGVDVTLTESIPNVGKKGQTVTLKYGNAEEYIRNRHDTGGDLNRAARQQQFMISLAKKIKDMGPVDIILNLYDELEKYVHTNLSTDQMLDFAKILTKTNIDSIAMLTVPGKGIMIDGTYFMIHDEAATLQMLLDVYYTKIS